MLSDLSPDELSRIEFRSSHWKVKRVQPFVSREKILNRLALVNGMAVPNQDDWVRNQIENLLQKANYLFACQTMPIRTNAQTKFFALWRYQQDTQQTQAFMVVNGGSQDRRLATPRPTALERRDERKTAFIFKSEGSVQLLALFLSSAIPLPSTALWLPHHGAAVGAVVAGCSSPSAASHARLHSHGSELQTTARSLGRSDPASSSFQRIRRHTLLYPTLSPSASPASRTASSDVPVNGWPFSSLAFSLPVASDPRCAS